MQSRVKFSSVQHSSLEILKYVHLDLGGPSSVKLRSGCKYFVFSIDEHSRKVWLYFLNTKHEDEVSGRFKEWKTMDEKETGNQVRSLRIENWLEFYKASFDKFYKNGRYSKGSHCTTNTTAKRSGRTNKPNTIGAYSVYEIICGFIEAIMGGRN